MTKEEAIEFGNMWLEMNEDCKDSSTYAFFHMAIKALEQEPCEDVISRQAVLDKAVYTVAETGWCGMTVDVEDIESLPSVTPAEKVGYWINTGSGQECSKCGEIQYGYDNFRKYCANCGSYNGGGDNGNE